MFLSDLQTFEPMHGALWHNSSCYLNPDGIAILR